MGELAKVAATIISYGKFQRQIDNLTRRLDTINGLLGNSREDVLSNKEKIFDILKVYEQELKEFETFMSSDPEQSSLNAQNYIDNSRCLIDELRLWINGMESEETSK